MNTFWKYGIVIVVLIYEIRIFKFSLCNDWKLKQYFVKYENVFPLVVLFLNPPPPRYLFIWNLILCSVLFLFLQSMSVHVPGLIIFMPLTLRNKQQIFLFLKSFQFCRGNDIFYLKIRSLCYFPPRPSSAKNHVDPALRFGLIKGQSNKQIMRWMVFMDTYHIFTQSILYFL